MHRVPVLLILWAVAFGGSSRAMAQFRCDALPGYCRAAAVDLFDGCSLNGWARRDGSPHTGWDVADEALHRNSGGGDLYYQSPVQDFELAFRWRISSGGNSGLKYRVRAYGNQWLGCEYQILDDRVHRDANKSAGLYDVFDPPPHSPPATANVWNESRIVVYGDHIEHWLNGIQTVNVTVGSERWKDAVAHSKFSGHPGFGENREGLIFLQDHGDEVWYRDLVLIPLVPVSAACPSGSVRQAGVCQGAAFRPPLRTFFRPRTIRKGFDCRRRGRR